MHACTRAHTQHTRTCARTGAAAVCAAPRRAATRLDRHACAHAHALMHTCTRTHACSHAHRHMGSQTCTHPHMHAHTQKNHMNGCAHTHKPAPALSCTHINPHTGEHAPAAPAAEVSATSESDDEDEPANALGGGKCTYTNARSSHAYTQRVHMHAHVQVGTVVAGRGVPVRRIRLINDTADDACHNANDSSGLGMDAARYETLPCRPTVL